MAFAGTAAGLTAGLMSTVWLSATETEVYAVTLLFGCMILWAADRAGQNSDARWALLAAYLAGLGWSLHLMALLVVPSAILPFSARSTLFRSSGGTALRRWQARSALVREAPACGNRRNDSRMTCVLFLLIRARHDPAITQGNPSTLGSLVDVILRRQYDVPHSGRDRLRFICSLGTSSSMRLAVRERTRFRRAAEPVENQYHDSLCTCWSLRFFCASECRPA